MARSRIASNVWTRFDARRDARRRPISSPGPTRCTSPPAGSQRELLAVLAEIDRSGRLGRRRRPRHGPLGLDALRRLRVEGRAVGRRGARARRSPSVADALATGRLCLDKVVELARFATAETEASLIRWAAARLLRRDPAQGRPRAEARARRDRRRRTHPVGPLVVRGRRHPVRAGGGAACRSGRARREGAVPPGRLGAADARRGRTRRRRRPQGRRTRDAVLGEDRERPRPRPRHGRRAHIARDPRGRRAERRGRGRPGDRARDRAPARLRRADPDRGRGPRTETRCGSAGSRACRRRRCSGSSATATASAGSPGAGSGDSRTPTTSAGGAAAAGPTWTTSSCSVRSTTGSSTRAAGRLRSTRSTQPAPSNGSGRAARSTGRVRRLQLNCRSRCEALSPASAGHRR